MTTPARLAQAIAIVTAGSLVVAGLVLLLRDAGASGPSRSAPEPPPPLIFAREGCSLTNDDAARAFVTGADGGASLVVGDRRYWLFGDTVLSAASGRQIEPNSIASSAVPAGRGCPQLTYHAGPSGAVPFLEKDGSLTVWPSGAWPLDDASFLVYATYVYGQGPYDYWIGEVGVARVDTRTMTAEVLARRLWDADSGFRSQVIGTQVVEAGSDGRLRFVLETESGHRLLARASPGQIAEAAAYEFWDGDGWTADEARAAPLWAIAAASSDLERLVSEEAAGTIAYDDAGGRYLSIVNVGAARLVARTAARLEGPWSAPVDWLDCTSFAQPAVPVCYSPYQHPQLASEDGRTIFLTLTRLATYDVVALELRPATPVRKYRPDDGTVTYGVTPPSGADEGIAFYASDVLLPGFARIYAWTRGEETMFGADAPEGFERGEPLFYAPLAQKVDGSLLTYRPVYDWRAGDTHLLSKQAAGLETEGYTRGEVVFYAP
ncbi:MAG: DUF4185 domain-containing protein [Dehalococcoidia bacterium]